MAERFLVLRPFAAILALGVAAAPAAAQEAGGEVEYLCTGVDEGSRSDPALADYPLKLVFAEADGDFLADVGVVIQDAEGATVLDVRCDAPWLLAALPPGGYDVAATAQGRTRTEAIDIGDGPQVERVIRFDGAEAP